MLFGKDVDSRPIVESLRTEEGKTIARLNLVYRGSTSDPDYNKFAAPILESKGLFFEAAEAYSIVGQEDDARRCYESLVNFKGYGFTNKSRIISILQNKLGRPDEARKMTDALFNSFLEKPNPQDAHTLENIAYEIGRHDLASKVSETNLNHILNLAKRAKADFAYDLALMEIAKTGERDRLVECAKDALNNVNPSSNHIRDFMYIRDNPDRFIEGRTSVELEDGFYDDDKGWRRSVEENMPGKTRKDFISDVDKAKADSNILNAERAGLFWEAAYGAVEIGDDNLARNYVALGVLLNTNSIQEAKGTSDLISLYD